MLRQQRRRVIAGLTMLALAVLVLGTGQGDALTTPIANARTPVATEPCAAAGTPATEMGGPGPMTDVSTPMAGMGQITPGTLGPGGAGQFDLMFIDLMIPHHESAVATARVALARAEHDEVRQLAEAIIASQTIEIEQMREWRAAWYGAAQPMLPMDQMIGMMGELMQGTPSVQDMPHTLGMAMSPAAEAEALCAAAGPFDLAFLDAMIPHHQSAIAMARVALANAEHPELTQLAQAIIDAQQREIEQMEQWREAWFGPETPVGFGEEGTAPVADRAGLVAALEGHGLTVEVAGRVEQPFLRAGSGVVLSVGGDGLAEPAEVQVFEYGEAAAAAEDAARLGPDGQPRRMRISWIGPPHFFRQGRLIVLYVGSDRAMLDALAELLGPQFAGR